MVRDRDTRREHDAAAAQLAAAIDLLNAQEAEAAEAAFRALLAVGPEWAPALEGLGRALYDQQCFDEAEAVFGKAAAVEDVPALARYHQGLCRLVQGDFENGWPLWEQRIDVPAFKIARPAIPHWDGSALGDRHLLVLAEQGFGDTIQFLRFLPRVVREKGGRVTFGVSDPLVRLVRPFCDSHGIELAIERVEAAGHDLYAPVCSLAGLLGVGLADLPGAMPYLTAEPDAVAAWRARLPEGRLRIGLSWAGRPTHPQDRARSCPIDALAPFGEVADIAWVGLQRPSSDATGPAPPGFLADDWGGEIGDFADTAAMIAALDLVITVDTAVAHLAGALGRPVLVMLPHAADWRWMTGRADSPWYPTMRLIRQGAQGRWADVVGRIADSLKSFAPVTTPTQTGDIARETVPAPTASTDSKGYERMDSSTTDEPKLELTGSRQFPSWLAEQNLSIAFSTYQAGKLFLIGLQPDGRLSIFERTFNRAMGLWTDGDVLYLSTLYQMWRFVNTLPEGRAAEGYDRVFVPRVAWTTGDLDIHDIALDGDGRLTFVNTLFSCLATVDESDSFAPLWKPPFITKLAAEDRCHLNGLAMKDGKPAFATAVSRADVGDGWRDRRVDGGVVIDIQKNEIVAEGLSMPHSPRWHDGKLWLLDSGNGYLGYLDPESGAFERVAFCPGYGRGLAIHGRFAIVGLSRPRGNKTFEGLPLDAALEKTDGEARCGLWIVDLESGDAVHWLRISGVIEELYDVAVLPGVTRPMAIGFKTDEIRRVISVGDDRPLAGKA
jgi:uncharacterized protein (TIGR03032 family)